MDFRKNDIGTSAPKTNSAAECQIMCQSIPECNFFTWKQNSKNCFLKTSDSGITAGGGSISGPKTCYPEGSKCYIFFYEIRLMYLFHKS